MRCVRVPGGGYHSHLPPPGPGHVHDFPPFAYCLLTDYRNIARDDFCTFAVGEWPCHISLLELGLNVLICHHPVLSCQGDVAQTGPAHWGLLNADAESLVHTC